MLPDFRFFIGAVLATGMLAVAGFGLATTVRLSHEARVGPTDTSRILAFNDRADWNQFSDPDLARRFEQLAHQADDADRAAASPPIVEQNTLQDDQEAAPAAVADPIEPPAVVADNEAAAPVESADLTTPVDAVGETSSIASETIAPAPQPAEPTPVAMKIEIAMAPAIVEYPAEAKTVEPPKGVEVLTDTLAALPAGEVTAPGVLGVTPLPKPKPKQAARRRPAKVKVAKVAKAARARTRATAAKPPAASPVTGYGYPAANNNGAWNGKFFGQ